MDGNILICPWLCSNKDPRGSSVSQPGQVWMGRAGTRCSRCRDRGTKETRGLRERILQPPQGRNQVPDTQLQPRPRPNPLQSGAGWIQAVGNTSWPQESMTGSAM